MEEKSGRITELLSEFRRGEPGADARLVAVVYAEMRRLARGIARRDREGRAIEPTALVHETYLRLVKQRPKPWKNRSHFFAVAALLMREILVDQARQRLARKRGQGKPHARLDSTSVLQSGVLGRGSQRSEDLLALDEALTALAEVSPRQCRVLELRYFSGMSCKEIAVALDIGERTVNRELAAGGKWLYARLRPAV